MRKIVPILGLLAISLTATVASATSRKADSMEEIKKKMALNKKVVCKVQASIFKTDSEGQQTGEIVDLDLFEGSPGPSSSSDFATYGIEYSDQKISFRYAMNSQSGLIEVKDQVSGANANVDLRIDDLISKPYRIGAILIENNSKLKLMGEKDPTHLRAECYIRR